MENPNKNHDHDPDLNLPGNYAHDKTNIFQTPAGYFEKLPLEVSDKIQTGTPGVILNTPAFSGVRLILAMAIVASIVAGSVFYLNKSGSDLKTEPVLSSDDLINTGMMSEFDESILVDAYMKSTVVANSPTKSTSNSASLSTEAGKTVESKALENYLIENNTDITLIINEL